MKKKCGKKIRKIVKGVKIKDLKKSTIVCNITDGVCIRY